MRYTDESFIAAIQSEGQAPDQTLAGLYENEAWRNAVFRLVQDSGGSREDAEDVFQEGLRRMIVNIRNGLFEGRSSLKTYHYRICRNLWVSQLRRDNRRQELQQALQNHDTGLDSEETLIQKERREHLAKALKLLGDNCRQVLVMWTKGYAMEEIAEAAGYKNGNVAKKRKRICLSKLIARVRQQPELMKILLEL
ncbi:MAG: sigma-70 family RNA polymerase sigma factor [Phaeodactylibacter sp.]|nr:sigma-70 family RNA polymerase sigma factor [Phaeodactylibacter sp.]